MATLSITKPTTAEIVSHSREFAIYAQLASSTLEAPITKDAFLSLAKKCGDVAAAEAFAAKGSGSFAEFAACFKRPGLKTPENGNCVAYATHGPKEKLVPFAFDRPAVGDNDVKFQMVYAGICHSDIHQARDEWGGSVFPMVPGHELLGIVTEVGKNVTKFKVGQRVGVGCFVMSCRSCKNCQVSLGQYCIGSPGCVFTYNYKHADGTLEQGGYSSHHVVNQDYVMAVPESLPIEGCAPLMCAGITVYSPMRYYGADKPGMKLGVMGLGGLGHMAVKFGKAFGMEVTVISTSTSKKEEALTKLKADKFLLSTDEEAMKAAANSLDAIVDTISAPHDVDRACSLLAHNGKLIMVGVPAEKLAFHPGSLIFKRITLGGSLIGGIAETQEMLDFCGQHGIVSDVEVIQAEQVNEAYERVVKSDVKYRFVIDCQASLVKA